jgi:hypothetical protein
MQVMATAPADASAQQVCHCRLAGSSCTPRSVCQTCAGDAKSDDHAREPSPEPNEGAQELAAFIINQECPKCGKVLTRGHKQHLASCSGKPQPTLAQLVELEVKKLEKLEHKLSELEVGGLVDLDEEKAVFVVVGSTGAALAACG